MTPKNVLFIVGAIIIILVLRKGNPLAAKAKDNKSYDNLEGDEPSDDEMGGEYPDEQNSQENQPEPDYSGGGGGGGGGGFVAPNVFSPAANSIPLPVVAPYIAPQVPVRNIPLLPYLPPPPVRYVYQQPVNNQRSTTRH